VDHDDLAVEHRSRHDLAAHRCHDLREGVGQVDDVIVGGGAAAALQHDALVPDEGQTPESVPLGLECSTGEVRRRGSLNGACEHGLDRRVQRSDEVGAGPDGHGRIVSDLVARARRLPMVLATWLGTAMDPSGIVSGLMAGIVIGLIARILVPTMQPVGCIMTILIGIVGAAAGLGLSNAVGWSSNFWLTFGLQILIATVLVAIVAALFRRSNT